MTGSYGSHGGAITISTYTTLTMLGTLVEKMNAGHALLSCCFPEHIYITISDTTFADNHGVGINLVSNTVATITRSQFLRNIGEHPESGGGGGGSIDTGTFSIADSVFDSNNVIATHEGGGLLLVGVIGVVKATVFSRNTVSGAGSNGAGVSISGGSTVDFDNSTFISNTADGFGSAVYVDGASTVSFTKTLVESNVLASCCGAVFIYDSSATFSEVSILNNVAEGQFGAGFHFSNSDITLDDSVVEGNIAKTSLGAYASAAYLTHGAKVTCNRVIFRRNLADWDTIHALSGSKLTCTDCKFIDNEVSTTGAILTLTSGSMARITSSYATGNVGESAFLLQSADSSLKVEDSIITNTSTSLALINDETGGDFAVVFDSVTFLSNAQPAFLSTGLVLVQNCEGLAETDVANVSVGGCENTLEYCMAEACTDLAVGTECKCLIDGAQQTLPIGCMESARIIMAVPSSLDMKLLAEKPGSLTQEMVLSNPGFEPLAWDLRLAGIVGLDVTPASGVLDVQGLVILSVSLESAHMQARAEPFVGNITITALSGVCACREQEAIIGVTIGVSAKASASGSEVTLLNAATVTASGTLEFEIFPVDSTGMALLDAADVAYFATVSHPPPATGSTICSVSYSAITKQHTGACLMPSLVTGEFTLRVIDVEGLSVGVVPVTVTLCPIGAYQNSAGECEECWNQLDCDAEGFSMANLPIKPGNWRPNVLSSEVYSCGHDGCAGGNRTGDGLCHEGATGALCGSCTFPTHYLSFSKRCELCDADAESLVYSVFAVGGVLFLMFSGSASYYADRRMVTVRAHWAYRMLSPARLKILWTLFQIISSVEATLNMHFPPPFSGLLDLLSFVQLDLMHLPVGCAPPPRALPRVPSSLTFSHPRPATLGALLSSPSLRSSSPRHSRPWSSSRSSRPATWHARTSRPTTTTCGRRFTRSTSRWRSSSRSVCTRPSARPSSRCCARVWSSKPRPRTSRPTSGRGVTRPSTRRCTFTPSSCCS